VQRIRQVSEYCESDVLNTYRVRLRYELFRGRLSDAEFQASEACRKYEAASPHVIPVRSRRLGWAASSWAAVRFSTTGVKISLRGRLDTPFQPYTKRVSSPSLADC
jgi:hypothetical protein